MSLTDVLEDMKRLEEEGLDLPQPAQDLAKVVRILLKFAGPLPASLIVNAIICRDVVVELTRDARRRGR
eukprot:5838325-Pyramimonas_sp.AAC.1